MNELSMTVTGWVATDPRMVMTREDKGTDMCSFRLAQTARYFDRAKQEWANGSTVWFTVRVFRDAAWTVQKSVAKGQPVIVEGRLRTNEWTDQNDKLHLDLQLDANAVGHDLTRGVADFTRTVVADGEPDEPEPGVDSASGGAAAPDVEDDASDATDLEPDVAHEDDDRAAVLA
ncbi:single-stranded DNA-binding protein [uncultured Demequina sp.]|uniref:single-stranded DNA-binding protein n=1 Tax=uncultured Demequina sp. TaxID=693499 RepID=UPI0025E9B0CA|nr:single-stranded DNA-binding protein [uncultured Demequina sp.]